MPDRIRVLVVTKSTGGLAQYNYVLSKGLDQARFELRTLCLSDGAEAYAERLRAAGTAAEFHPMARYSIDPVGDFRTALHVRRLVRGFRPDVILCHGSKPGFIGRMVGRICGVPCVYRQASMPFLRRIQGRKAPVYWTLELVARSFRGRMVALSHYARRTTIRLGVSHPDLISVILTGIDTGRFRATGRRDEMRRKFGLDPDRPVVGWIGRLEPQKAPGDYCKTLETLCQRHPDAQFLLAGEGRLAPEVDRALASGPLKGRVVRLPWQSDPREVFEASDIFALSSLWEGLPIVLLEAMAMGCVPVVTDVDGCSEVIEPGKNGFLVPAAQPDRMADAISALLSDPDRLPALSAAARARIETAFDQGRMIREWEELFASMAGRAGGQGA